MTGKLVVSMDNGTDTSGSSGVFYLGVDATIETEGKAIQALFACLYGIEDITIPEGITTIGTASFWNAVSLHSVDLPSSVTDILDEAFYYCTSLKSIYCHMTVPANVSDDTVFEGVDKENCTLYVPIGSAELYRTAEYWKDFKNIVEYDYGNSTGIDKVTTDSSNQGDAHEVARYSINGQRLNAPTQGLNIVKYSDGTTKKVMVP